MLIYVPPLIIKSIQTKIVNESVVDKNPYNIDIDYSYTSLVLTTVAASSRY